MTELFRINNNPTANFAQRQLAITNRTLNEAQERLASGLRINSASDDAAGLAISERMRMAQRGMEQASDNAQDGLSIMQTAEGGLENIQEHLQRIRELAVQAANDSLTDNDRQLISAEVSQIIDEIDRSASSVQFNNRQLLKNDFGLMGSDGQLDQLGQGSLHFHVGPNRDDVIRVTRFDLVTTTGVSLGLRDFETDTTFPVLTRELAESAIERTTIAIDAVSQRRAWVGAMQNRLEGVIRFLDIQKENNQAAESRIRDADIAEEAVKRTRASILMQAGTSVLQQANQTPQLALSLLG